MSHAQITLTDVDGATEVEVKLSDNNAESPAVIMAIYLSQNWDVVCEACRRHLVLRQNHIDRSDVREIAPKIINSRGEVIRSTED